MMLQVNGSSTPSTVNAELLLNFLVLRVRLAPLAVFLEFDLALDKLAVFARPIVDATALAACELYKLILRHNAANYTQNIYRVQLSH